jgi:Ni,Fe-hydrogenase I cytochrome b subunit
MSPAEMRELRVTADNPASKEIRNPLAYAAMVAVAVMPIVEVAAEKAAGIEAAGKRADEEFNGE